MALNTILGNLPLKQGEFIHNGKTYRLVRLHQYEKEYGYAEPSEEHYNVLQVRLTNPFEIFMSLSRWKTIEMEHVPSYAWISVATLGFTDWKSTLVAKCRNEMGMSAETTRVRIPSGLLASKDAKNSSMKTLLLRNKL